jgi:hypothetical protein
MMYFIVSYQYTLKNNRNGTGRVFMTSSTFPTLKELRMEIEGKDMNGSKIIDCFILSVSNLTEELYKSLQKEF